MRAIERAQLSLEGLSVGDAFGERFFGPPHEAVKRIVEREIPAPPWTYTDDTEMAISILEVLRERGTIDQVIETRPVERRAQRGHLELLEIMLPAT
jgi:ADP-ribosylglycohydrolase